MLSAGSDVVIGGGAAGSGKTFVMILMALCAVHIPGFSGIIFRRLLPQIGVGKQGTLWAEAVRIYKAVGGRPIPYKRMFEFQTGPKTAPATMSFDHLQYESDTETHMGVAYPFIGFEELTHFTAHQFYYLLSRNRLGPGCVGVKPWCFATCNPDPDSFVFDLVKPFLDDNLYPHPEKVLEEKYFVLEGDDYTPHFVKKGERGANNQPPTSLTFVPALLTDNRILMEADPNYLEKLNSLPKYMRDGLLGGCWGIRRGTSIFVDVIPRYADAHEVPADLKLIRAWDRGSARKQVGRDPDMTAGALGGHRIAEDGVREFWVVDVEYFQGNPGDCVRIIRNTADRDGWDVPIYIEEETGSSGKDAIYFYRNEVLRGFDVRSERPTGDKGTRALGWIEDGVNGRLVFVRGTWNRAVLDAMQAFPGGKRDVIDCTSLLHSASLQHPWPTPGGIISGRSRVGSMRDF